MNDNDLVDDLAQAILEVAEPENKKPIIPRGWGVGFFVFIIFCVVLGIYSSAGVNEETSHPVDNQKIESIEKKGVEPADGERKIDVKNPGNEQVQEEQRSEYHIGVGCRHIVVTRQNVGNSSKHTDKKAKYGTF